MENSFGALILAGGESQRMAYPKAFLRIHGRTFLENIIRGYSQAGAQRINVVLNSKLLGMIPDELRRYPQLKIIPNSHPELGRFYSLLSGLKDLVNNDFVFIHNCDNPFVRRSVLRRMFKRRDEGDYVVPVFRNHGGHPVLISGKIIREIVSESSLYDSLRDVLSKVRRVEVNINAHDVLLNINTRKEYEQLVSGKVAALQ